jgi:zinc transporter ZupT
MATGTLKVFFALSIFIVILMAGYYPFRKKRQNNGHLELPLGETLGTGVFLGAALLHMLPESNQLFVQMGYHYPFAFIITGLFFLVFLWFEHLGKELYHHRQHNHPAFALVAWMMLSIHSLVLGTALGITHEYPVVMMLFLAIITHKWAESLAISMQLNQSSLTPKMSAFFFMLFAFMTPLGVFIGWHFGQTITTQSLIDPILIAASAGTFLYLGTLHGLERCVMVKRCCNLRDFSFVIVGFLLMAAVAAYG